MVCRSNIGLIYIYANIMLIYYVNIMLINSGNIYCQLLNKCTVKKWVVCFSGVQAFMCSKIGANEQFSAKGVLVFSA